MSRNRHSKNRRNQNVTGAQNASGARRTGGQRGMQQQRTGGQQRGAGGTQSAQLARMQSSGEDSSMQSGAMPSSMSAMTSGAIDSARKSLESIGTSALDLANSALRTVKANPVPFALAGAGVVCAGAGITWLLLSGAKSAAESAAGEGATGGRSSMPSLPSMRQAKQSMKRAGEKASQLAHGALESGKKLETSVEDVVREHPIAVGAALLATGAAIGLAMPRTALEDTWLGRERDQLVSSAKSLAQGAVSKVESMAKQVSNRSSNNLAHA